MDKKEIKKDLIRERIVRFFSIVTSNSQYVLIAVIAVIMIIGGITLYISNLNEKKAENNKQNGIVLTDIRYSDENLLELLDKMAPGDMKFILKLSDALRENRIDDLKKELNSHNLNNKDNKLLSSYVLFCEALIDSNSESKIDSFKKAVSMVPSYDLKAEYAFALLDYFISISKYSDANEVLNEIILFNDKLNSGVKTRLEIYKGKIKFNL